MRFIEVSKIRQFVYGAIKFWSNPSGLGLEIRSVEGCVNFVLARTKFVIKPPVDLNTVSKRVGLKIDVADIRHSTQGAGTERSASGHGRPKVLEAEGRVGGRLVMCKERGGD